MIDRVKSAFGGNYPSQILIGRLGATALAFVTSPIVARSIGPDGRGETAAAIALFFLIPILLGIGLPTEVRRRAARGDGARSVRTARALTLALFPLSGALGALGYFTLFASFDTDARLVATLGVVVCPFMVSWTCDQSVLIASGRYRAVMILQLTQPTIYFLAIVGLWVASAVSTSAVMAAHVVGTLAAALVGFLLSKVSLGGSMLSAPEMLRGSVRYAGSAIAESASSRLDQVLMLPLAGAFHAGIYAVAATLASLPLAIGHALAAPYFRRIAAAKSSQDVQREKEEAVRVSIAAGIMVVAPLLVAMWAGIPLLFGPDFVQAVPVGWILSLGSAAMIVSFVCSQSLTAQGMGYRMTLAQGAALALSILLLLSFAPWLGAIGAAVASTTGYLILVSLLLWALRIGPRSALPRWRDFRSVVSRLLRSE